MADILVSDTTFARYRDLIGAACGEHRLLAFDPAAPGDLSHVEAAFVSVDYLVPDHNPATNPKLGALFKALPELPRLRWLHLCSAGADRPVYKDMMRRGITVTTSSGANAKAVAHTAIAGALALARGVPQWIDTQARKVWERAAETPRDIDGARATVIGLGPIGLEIASICRALGMHVTGVRRSQGAKPDELDAMVTPSALPELLPETDWLFIACPLTEETRGLFDRAMLARMKPGSHLINVGRGRIVDEQALADALASGALAGAYSDVFATEPLQADSPLWTAPRFLMSPHCGGLAQGFERRTVEMFAENLRRWNSGLAMLNVARPE